MKIKIWSNTHANIYSKYEEVFNIEDICDSLEIWNDYTLREKEQVVKEFLLENERLDWGFEEL